MSRRASASPDGVKRVLEKISLQADIGQNICQDKANIYALLCSLTLFEGMWASLPTFSRNATNEPGGIMMKKSQKKRSNSRKKVNKKHTRSKKSLLEQKLEMINPNAAGIDVASEEMWVCVPEDR